MSRAREEEPHEIGDSELESEQRTSLASDDDVSIDIIGRGQLRVEPDERGSENESNEERDDDGDDDNGDDDGDGDYDDDDDDGESQMRLIYEKRKETACADW